MVEVCRPCIAESPEGLEEYLEMVLLLASDDIDQAVVGPGLVAEYGGADILGDVEARAVLAEEDLLVELDILEVCPDRAVVLPIEHAGCQSRQDVFDP